MRKRVRKFVLVVGGKPYKVRLVLDEAKLTVTQMRSVLEHVEKHGGWMISHRLVYDPNYDGARAPTKEEERWKPLTPAGLRQLIRTYVHPLHGVNYYYDPKQKVFKITSTWGDTIYLKPAKPIKIKLKI